MNCLEFKRSLYEILKKIVVISVASIILSSSAYAINASSAGLKIGTLGFGLEFRNSLSDIFFEIIGENYLPFKTILGSDSSDGSALKYKFKRKYYSKLH